MRKHLIRLAAAVMLTASFSANAIPTSYSLNFTANLGPSGVGSLTFDDTSGAITDFFWDFGGIIGGQDDLYGTQLVFGDTFGRFVFEMLSQTDVHSGSNCIGGAVCSSTGPFTSGSAPGGATVFRIDTAMNSVNYAFRGSMEGPTLASGVISFATTKVPEPSTAALLLAALMGLGFAFRSRRT